MTGWRLSIAPLASLPFLVLGAWLWGEQGIRIVLTDFFAACL